MGGVFDFQQQVAAEAALPRQPDHLPRPHAGRDAHVEGAAIHADAHAVAAIDRLQRDRQARARLAHARPRRTARATRTRPAAVGLATEQAFEEITEAAARATAGEHVVVVEPGRTAGSEARRRHFVAGTVAAGAQLVVGLAPGGVAQRLVCLVDGLELVLGAGFLADVGMVFAREPAVGGLDLRLSGIGLHAQDAVVILELHARSTTTARVRAVAVY